MTKRWLEDRLWTAIHQERAALLRDLGVFTEEQWRQRSLCDRWTVQDVVAHLTAGASLGRLRWLRSIAGAGFRPSVHNQRRLVEFKGADPAQTLGNFRAIVDSRTAPSKDTPAWLGEVIVHGQDIRRPLGLAHRPPVDATTQVAQFFASRNFTVPSRRAVDGLCLEATDGPFTAGSGPVATGPTLSLTMAMAGRDRYLEDLDGPGVPLLAARVSGHR